MTKEYFADLFVNLFPEKSHALTLHYQSYHKLLGHVFFPDEINIPLRTLLYEAQNETEIYRYCEFIENMWFEGDDAVRNIVTVSILEGLDEVWINFGRYLSKEFIWIINNELLHYMAVNVPRLPHGLTMLDSGITRA